MFQALKTLKSKKEEKLDVVTKEELDRMHFDKMAKWQQKKLLNLIEKNKQKADAKAQQTKHQLDKSRTFLDYTSIGSKSLNCSTKASVKFYDELNGLK